MISAGERKKEVAEVMSLSRLGKAGFVRSMDSSGTGAGKRLDVVLPIAKGSGRIKGRC